NLSLTVPCTPPNLTFFNDTSTPNIYTLSLHDALPIFHRPAHPAPAGGRGQRDRAPGGGRAARPRRHPHHVGGQRPGSAGRHAQRSEEHTSELQSQSNLVCRLLLEKKKKEAKYDYIPKA